MDEVLKRKHNEKEEEYIWRLGQMKDSGRIDLGWVEIAHLINKEFREDESEYQNEATYRKPYQQAKRFYEAGVFKDLTGEAYVEVIKQEQLRLQKEKQKVRDEKVEYNKWLREESREELIAEKICDAIKTLPEIEVPEIILKKNNNERAGILVISDAHYGKEVQIKGLFGDILNEYSPEIFESRMWDLLEQTVRICKKEGFNELNVYDLGDELQGILRMSDLIKLRYGVIESVVRYGRFISSWLNELTKYVRVKYQMVNDSNHCQLRLINAPKNTFKEENMAYIIVEKIMDIMKDNPNFEFVQNDSGFIFDTICGYNILGYHGEGKELSQAIKNLSSMYKTKIDFLIGGHRHFKQSINVGIESDVIGVPSIIGIDDYSMELQKTSDSGALLLVLEEGKGNVIEYNIKLK